MARHRFHPIPAKWIFMTSSAECLLDPEVGNSTPRGFLVEKERLQLIFPVIPFFFVFLCVPFLRVSVLSSSPFQTPIAGVG
jgi:hypothetical protein